ncbi:MAG: uridine kinase [Deltaproteobacteria bacterium]|jgi:uridine kinase|nr:uridine kinase [Deltaproteobacteria bacterium]MBW2530840.1 uridine kinase [Deltaproteobacteria bacterium]
MRAVGEDGHQEVPGRALPLAATKRPFVIGIGGGSGSGKTTIVRELAAALGEHSVVAIEQDAYYRDLSHLPLEERVGVNFDHPDALELSLLVEHIDALCSGKAIHKPRYDFEMHLRSPETDLLEPRPVILVEGIMVLVDADVRERMDLKLFVDTAADIRLMRRIRRDLESRGRTFSQIRRQYYRTVRPMHMAFVEPSKEWANVIIPEGGQNSVALDLLLGRIREFIREYQQ